MDRSARERIAQIRAELAELSLELKNCVEASKRALAEPDLAAATIAVRQVSMLNSQISDLTAEWRELAGPAR